MPKTGLLKESLKIIEYTLLWTGVPLEKREGVFHKFHVLFIFNFIWMNTDWLGAVGWFLNAAKEGRSLTSLTYVAPCITLTILANFKAICMVVYNEQINEILLILKELEAKEAMRAQCKEKEDYIKKETAFLHLVLKLLNFFNWMLIIAFPLMPLGLTLIYYIQKQEFVPLLPLLILYPFNAFDVRVWPFIFVRQIWSIMVVILEVGGTDFIFFISSTYIRIQFWLVGFELDRVIGDASGPCTPRRIVNIHEGFKEIVKWHQQLIRATDLLELVYGKSTLFNFVSSSALICLTGFNVTTIDDVAFVISFLSFLFMSLLQIYFLCLFGDMLMRASVSVSDSVYNSKWYLSDKRTAKMLFFMQTRAQKACRLTAYGFADVNLMSFTRILSTAWSYFALLKTVNN